MKKVWTIAKTCMLIFGLVGVIIGLVNTALPANDRILYVCLGIFACIIALVSLVRWVLVSILFFGVALTGVPEVIGPNGKLDVAYLMTVIFCFVLASWFGYKAYGRFKYLRISKIGIAEIDRMSGLEFEEYTAKLLKKLHYRNVSVTKASGDQGIDVLAEKDGISYAIQCKNYSDKLDNTPVQEACAGKQFYGCDVGVVITNSTFSDGARELADATGVLLWDRNELQDMICQSGGKTQFQTQSQCAPYEGETEATASMQGTPEITSKPRIITKRRPIKPQTSSINEQYIAEAQWYAARDNDE